MTDWKAYHAAERRQILAAFCMHWEGAYGFMYGRGRWVAQRLDNGKILTARYPDDLERLVIADYWRHPVPRDLEVVSFVSVFW